MNVIILLLTIMVNHVLGHSTEHRWLQNATLDDEFQTSNTGIYPSGSASSISRFRETFCMFLNISLFNCSCKVVPQLCQVQRVFSSHNVANNTGKPSYKRLNATTLVYASVAILASIFGVVGNLAVLLIAFQHQLSTLSSCKLHIAELAAVNLVFSIVQIINTIPLYWTNSWIYSLFMCKLLRTLLEIGSLLTSGFIQIIAYERYKLVVAPIRSQIFNGRFRHTLVIINIIIVIATVIPYSLALDIEEYSGRCVMFTREGENIILTYNSFVIVLYSLLPICMLSTFLFKMMWHLSGKEKLSSKKCVRVKLIKRNRHIMLITLLILSLFILCTLPTRAITVYMENVGYQTSSVSQYISLTLISYFTYPLQSTLNPILYSVIAKNWRKDAKKSLSIKFVNLKESLL